MEDATKPLEEAKPEAAAETSPVVEPSVETPAAQVEDEKPQDAVVTDVPKNACSNCNGQGLVGNLEIAGQHSLCPTCGGKGVV